MPAGCGKETGVATFALGFEVAMTVVKSQLQLLCRSDPQSLPEVGGALTAKQV